MIEIKGLEKAFRKKKLFDNLSLSLGNGTYALLGPNGSGKTTLIRCILGLYSYKGKISFDGKAGAARTGYLPQAFGLFPDLTVWEAMQYFSLLKHTQNEKEEIESCLRAVDMLDKKDVKCRKLSGGMVRRVGIAQALLGDADLLIFDEPTAGLDPEERLRFKNIIASLGSENKTVILSTHILEDVEDCCGKIVVMNGGAVLKTGSSEEIAACAENKVYQCEYSDFMYYKDAALVKRFQSGSRSMCRFISAGAVNLESLPPTVEDGYLCLIKSL